MENDHSHIDTCGCKKVYCVQCRKVIFKKDCIEKYGTAFCSMKCCNKYDPNNFSECKACSQKILIDNSLRSFKDKNVYYCSSKCREKIEPKKKI